MNKSEEVLQDKIINDLALNYAICLVKYGVDIREKWETATQNKFALEQAYLRGREDERKRIEEVEEQGLFLKLPCEPNKYVWCANTFDTCKVVYPSKASIMQDMELGYGIGYTKEEAAAKLKELQSNT